MSVNKIKIFKVKLSPGTKVSLDSASQDAIRDFLNDPNNVYVGHSTSTLSEDIEEFGLIKTVNKHLLITLIYKDLAESNFDLRTVSKKVSKVVVRQFESDVKMAEPKVETAFEKECKAKGIAIRKN